MITEDCKEKYKEALEKAKEEIKKCGYNKGRIRMIENIFPELKESEDEKIRKGIIEYLEQSQFGEEHYQIDDDIVRGYIAWLEKQSEQTSTDEIKPKFKVGDWVVNDKMNVTVCIKDITYHYNTYTPYGVGCIDFDNENDWHLWTIQDAKDGDVLALDWKNERHWQQIVIFKSLSEFGVEGYGNNFANNKLAFKMEDVPFYSKTWSKCLQPATKEQRDTLERAMTNAGYRWNKKELKLEKI